MKVGWIGTGAMGSRVASRLAAADHQVTVWNRSRERAAAVAAGGSIEVADDLAALAASCEVLVAAVRDDAASREVWSQVLPHIAPGTPCIDVSTISVARATAFVEEVAAAGGVGAVAPMIGSLPQAQAGALVFLAAGSDAATRAAASLLSPAAGEVRPVATPATAARLKLAVNAMLAMQTAALRAIWPLLPAGEESWDVIRGLPVFSDAARGLAARMLAGESPSMFPIELVAKDLGYAIDEVGAADPVLAATEGTFAAAVARGEGTLDISQVPGAR